MIKVIYRWRVQAGHEANFEAAWREMTASIRDVRQGARGSMLLRDRQDPAKYTAVATWEHYADWERSGQQESANREAGEHMRSASEFISYDVFDVVDDMTV